ncbi:MAG TPA: hypothetical protein VFW96_11235 [Thermomicrobiales bacterium]|nr:hypothetical protein [Thermomicrobiales bacterium]
MGEREPSEGAAGRERRLARALRLVEARLGPDVARRLAAPRPWPAQPTVPTGSLGLDLATGVGGFPRGHLTEVVGAESSGKTTLLYGALAATQRDGGLVALVDAEGSADPAALAGCGANLDALLVILPASACDAVLALAILARCGALDLLALSSIAALRDLPYGRATPAGLAAERPEAVARLLARGLRVLAAGLADGPTAVVAANALLPGAGWPSPGGRALRHHAALRVLVEPLAPLPDGAGGWRGLRVALTVVKSKVAVPGGRAAVDLLPGRGVDRPAELLALGLAAGLIADGPHGLAWGGAALGGDARAARRRLAADPALAERLAAAIVTASRPAAAA